MFGCLRPVVFECLWPQSAPSPDQRRQPDAWAALAMDGITGVRRELEMHASPSTCGSSTPPSPSPTPEKWQSTPASGARRRVSFADEKTPPLPLTCTRTIPPNPPKPLSYEDLLRMADDDGDGQVPLAQVRLADIAL